MNFFKQCIIAPLMKCKLINFKSQIFKCHSSIKYKGTSKGSRFGPVRISFGFDFELTIPQSIRRRSKSKHWGFDLFVVWALNGSELVSILIQNHRFHFKLFISIFLLKLDWNHQSRFKVRGILISIQRLSRLEFTYFVFIFNIIIF